MRFSYSLLKKYFKFNISEEKLAELLTLHLAETKVSYLNKKPILEVDLLPNRISDCAGHFGLLREIAVLFGKKFDYPKVVIKKEQEAKEKIKDLVEVKIKSPFCYRYEMRAIFEVKVKESPLWLQEILKECGLRPINNVVDIVNYVMLLTGQPLHVFDFQKVAFNKFKKKEIIVREAKKGEKIVTLDNKLFELNTNHLLITDSENILALAGIKGGKIAEVDENTQFILIESANFSPENIRKTSQELNLKTDASFRFEHNLDSNLTDYSLDLAAVLIQELAGGKILKGKIDKKLIKSKKPKIKIKLEEFEKFSGFKLPSFKILRSLKLLGFEVKIKKDLLIVTPPIYRTDILVKEDIIGEVLRIVGFNKIKGEPPKEELVFKEKSESWILKNKLKDLFKNYGFLETYNYSFISEKDAQLLSLNNRRKLIEILNPTSDLFKFLRPTLAFNFLKNINYNFTFEDNLRLFEVSNCFLLENSKQKEELVAGGVMATKKEKEEENLFFKVKGILEGVFMDLGLENDYSIKELKEDSFYSDLLQKGGEIYLKDKKLGVIGVFKKEVLKNYDIKGSVVCWEFKVFPLKDYLLKDKIYRALSKYPPVKRDLSVMVLKETPVLKVIELIKNSSLKYLKEIELFDIYYGENLEKGYKSLSFHLIFQAEDKTLTSEEVDKEIKKIISNFTKFNIKIR